MPLNYEKLNEVYLREKRGQFLTRVEGDFYEAAITFLGELKAVRERAAAEPTSREAILAGEELTRARELLRDLYDLRARKVVLLAWTAASGTAVDTKPLTPAELDLYETLRAAMAASREAVLGGTKRAATPLPPAGTHRPESTSPPPVPGQQPSSAVAASPAPPAPPPSILLETHRILRMKDDVKRFVDAGGRVYYLRKKDIVSLPKEIAAVVVRRGTAGEIDVR